MERACMLKLFPSCVGRRRGMVKYEGWLQRRGLPGEEKAWKTHASLPPKPRFWASPMENGFPSILILSHKSIGGRSPSPRRPYFPWGPLCSDRRLRLSFTSWQTLPHLCTPKPPAWNITSFDFSRGWPSHHEVLAVFSTTLVSEQRNCPFFQEILPDHVCLAKHCSSGLQGNLLFFLACVCCGNQSQGLRQQSTTDPSIHSTTDPRPQPCELVLILVSFFSTLILNYFFPIFF